MSEELHRYYRCKNPRVLEAVKTYFAQREALHKKVRAFVKKWGGTDALWWSTFDYIFAGIMFTRDKPPMNEDLWTKPSKEGLRQPKQTAKQLRAEFFKDFPKDKVLYEPWLTALGLKQGLGGRPGLSLTKGGKAVYIHSSEPIKVPKTVEITASEYEKATKG